MLYNSFGAGRSKPGPRQCGGIHFPQASHHCWCRRPGRPHESNLRGLSGSPAALLTITTSGLQRLPPLTPHHGYLQVKKQRIITSTYLDVVGHVFFGLDLPRESARFPCMCPSLQPSHLQHLKTSLCHSYDTNKATNKLYSNIDRLK